MLFFQIFFKLQKKIWEKLLVGENLFFSNTLFAIKKNWYHSQNFRHHKIGK